MDFVGITPQSMRGNLDMREFLATWLKSLEIDEELETFMNVTAAELYGV